MDRYNLIAGKIKQSVNDAMSKTVSSLTVSDRVSDIGSNFYDRYIKDWTLIAIVVTAILFMLVCRYYDKSDRGDFDRDTTNKVNNEPFTSEEQRIMKELIADQTKNLKYDDPPHFNKLQSVNQQQQYINYPPQVLPLNLPGVGQTYNHSYNPSNSNYTYPPQYQNLNTPTYDYNNVYSYPDRSYYNGTLDTYQGAEDTNITNPLGFSNDFNSTTGSFISGMTGANRENVIEYQQILENMKNNLTQNVGPNHLNAYDEPTMIPPYATGM